MMHPADDVQAVTELLSLALRRSAILSGLLSSSFLNPTFSVDKEESYPHYNLSYYITVSQLNSENAPADGFGT